MKLRWRTHPHMTGTYIARGVRGTYTVQRVDRQYILDAEGYDGIMMPAMPFGGKRFDSGEAAQWHAEHLDALPEPQISGA